MKVFISWSGDLSNKVALVLRDWLPSVIQAIEPYVSSEDIDKGARWSTDIAKELESSRFGILCVTKDNIEAPWLNFEAGALSKAIEKSRVFPFLFGLKRSEVRTGPLLQFQSTIYDHEDISKLLHSLNTCVEPRCIEPSRLDAVFDVWWPRLQESLKPLLDVATASATHPGKQKEAKLADGQSEILEELLKLARNQQTILNSPEMLLPGPYLEHVFRRSGGFGRLHPEALHYLAKTFERLRDIVESVKEGEQLPVSLVRELTFELRRPIDYILAEGRDRRPSKGRPDPSEEF